MAASSSMELIQDLRHSKNAANKNMPKKKKKLVPDLKLESCNVLKEKITYLFIDKENITSLCSAQFLF